MANKLDKLRLELKKARGKRDEWIARTRELEKKVIEEENTQINELVRSVHLTPESLAELLDKALAAPDKVQKQEAESYEA